MTTNNGLLLIDKPRGVTSHDVVARVRKLLNEQRVGHAGTLDPMATGLLVLAVGPSTRLLRFAQSQTKRYRGVVTFGVATDSLDADGAVVERREVPAFSTDEVNDVARRMLGRQQQTPPMVSALKVDGRRLHALAREGVVIERAPRDVTIDALSLEPSAQPGEWSFDVTCSVGTYVRVLLADLAAHLNTIGHLSALRRTQSGDHRVDDAVTLDELELHVQHGTTVLRAPREFVVHLDSVVVDREQALHIRQGKRVLLDHVADGEIAAISERGNLVAVLRPRGEVWQPTVVLPEEDADARE
jgi:tRNA pseudouridine55 synthase